MRIDSRMIRNLTFWECSRRFRSRPPRYWPPKTAGSTGAPTPALRILVDLVRGSCGRAASTVPAPSSRRTAEVVKAAIPSVSIVPIRTGTAVSRQ
jgi:hypothetical protein